MQHDDVIWQSLNSHFCSFKVTTSRHKLCRNKYNLTGVCDRFSCPLANSRYATIIENDGRLYLFVKTAERAHSPRNLWERILLPSNYRNALAQIDEHLQYWPQRYIHKAKQRLTKMTQYLLRKKKLALQKKSRLVGIKKKVDRREKSREAKAFRAAKLEASIEKELLERLKSNAYGDIYNFDQEAYEKVLEAQLDEEEGELNLEDDQEDMEDVDEYEAQLEDSDEEELDDIEQAGVQPPSGQFDFDDDSEEDSDEDEDQSPRSKAELDSFVRSKARQRRNPDNTRNIRRKGRKLRKPKGGVELEYERESEKRTETA